MTQTSRAGHRVLGWAFFLVIAGLACGPSVRAQAPGAGVAQVPGFVDKGLGEEDEIRQRAEWFFGSRRAGVGSDAEMWSLRLAAVQKTREALVAQRVRQSLGFEGTQNVWVEMGPSPSNFGGWSFGTVSGRIQVIEADWASGTLYVGAASGGVWKSTNDGLSWTSIFDNAGTVSVGAIHIDPNDSNVIWVGTGDNISGCESYFGIGLLRSPDGGQSWELRNGSGANTLDEMGHFAGVTVDPRDSNRLVVAGRYRGCASGSQADGGIYTSDDGGLNWIARLFNVEVHEIVRDPVVPDILWASSDDGIYRSTNNGVTWSIQTNSGLPNGSLSRTEIALAPSDPNTVYALFDNPSDHFWRTTDGGASWTLMNSDACDGQCSYNMVIRVDPNDPDTVYRGTIRIFKSTDGGMSWDTLTDSWGGSQQVHQDTHSLLMHPTISGSFYVGSDGGIWKSTDGGATFVNANGNLNVTQFYAIDVDANDPGRICGGAQDNSSLATDNSLVWERQAVTGDGFVCQLDPFNSNNAYITSYPSGGYPNIWRSTSGLFGSFVDVTGPGSGVNVGDRSNWVTPYVLDPTSPNTLYLGTHRAYRSTNFGGTWNPVGPSDLTNSGSSSLRVMEINRNFPTVLFSGATSGAVYRTIDAGVNWIDLTSGLPTRSINDIAADPTNPDRAFAVVGGFNTGHVWEWNAATGWADRSNGLPNVPANTVLMISDTDILVGLDTGVFRSVDGGQNWLPYMTGIPEGIVVSDLKFNALQSVVTAGTYARGAWQVALGPVQPILLFDSVEQPLIEIDGDADGKIEPGETWGVRPLLRNAGGQTALGVTARLSSPTPGVTVLLPDTRTFPDLGPGVAAPVIAPYEFTIDPSFTCGEPIVFDLLEIASPTPPGTFGDQFAVYSAVVQGGNAAPDVTELFQEDFDPDPPAGWAHEAVDANLPECPAVTNIDEWQLASKDAGHGTSYHAGAGPGGLYERYNYGWLHPVGKDSDGGAGILVPADALAATMTVVHWYETIDGQDGGQVALDVTDNGLDLYTTINPVGGYPGTLDVGFCNGLEGQGAFQGSSGGWITSQFDLTPYKGGTVWPTFVFASDRRAAAGEGWYVDEVLIEYLTEGPPICDIARWPGAVDAATFNLTGPGSIEAGWNDACNVTDFPEQTYSIQAGDLDALLGSGTYTHAPVGGLCDRLSSATFAPGAGNEYYVIVPSGEAREGGHGDDSQGNDRPQPDGTCGQRRIGCP